MNQENQNTEYKRIWQDENLKSICAFANTNGGTIYVGIDDEGNVSRNCGFRNWKRRLLNKETMMSNPKYEQS